MSNLSEAHRYNGIVHKSAHTKIKTINICWAFGILSCAYKHNQFEFKECHNNRNLKLPFFWRYLYLTMNCQYFGNLLINSMKCIHLRRIHIVKKNWFKIQMRKNRTLISRCSKPYFPRNMHNFKLDLEWIIRGSFTYRFFSICHWLNSVNQSKNSVVLFGFKIKCI